jgi:hypothetical protein
MTKKPVEPPSQKLFVSTHATLTVWAKDVATVLLDHLHKNEWCITANVADIKAELAFKAMTNCKLEITTDATDTTDTIIAKITQQLELAMDVYCKAQGITLVNNTMPEGTALGLLMYLQARDMAIRPLQAALTTVTGNTHSSHACRSPGMDNQFGQNSG